MATKTKKRRAVIKGTPKVTAGESWQIVGPDELVIRETVYGEGATLSLAQNLMKLYTEWGDSLTVRWKALFGEPDPLFHLVREEDGSFTTRRV